MLKNKTNPAQNATSTQRTEPFSSRQEVHAAMVKDPNLQEAKAFWDENNDYPVMVKRSPADGIRREYERIRFSPLPEPGQPRVACYVV